MFYDYLVGYLLKRIIKHVHRTQYSTWDFFYRLWYPVFGNILPDQAFSVCRNFIHRQSNVESMKSIGEKRNILICSSVVTVIHRNLSPFFGNDINAVHGTLMLCQIDEVEGGRKGCAYCVCAPSNSKLSIFIFINETVENVSKAPFFRFSSHRII